MKLRSACFCLLCRRPLDKNGSLFAGSNSAIELISGGPTFMTSLLFQITTTTMVGVAETKFHIYLVGHV